MGDNSKIEWTDSTDNIIVAADGGWWCRHVTRGCDNCYAEKLNQSSYFGGNKLPYSGDAPPLKLREDIIDAWSRKTKPKRRFVMSMSDAFGEWVPQPWVFRFLDGMRAAPRQTFQLLTKRPAVMRRSVEAWLSARDLHSMPSNIWLGVSVTCQRDADSFLPILLEIAATRFISAEPLLDSVEAHAWLHAIHWVIVGGESGPHARPMHPTWARSLREQCIAANVPFFFKQWGEFRPDGNGISARVRARHLWSDGEVSVLIGKKAAGRMLDGRTWDAFPDSSIAP